MVHKKDRGNDNNNWREIWFGIWETFPTTSTERAEKFYCKTNASGAEENNIQAGLLEILKFHCQVVHSGGYLRWRSQWWGTDASTTSSTGEGSHGSFLNYCYARPDLDADAILFKLERV